MSEAYPQVFDEQYMSESNVFQADNRLYVKFYMKPVQNAVKSAEQGRPIFDEKEYVKIIVPGDKNLGLDRPANAMYKARFQRQYELFKKGSEQATEGTPLEAVTWLTVGQVAEFKALNIFTVEQLATVPDSLAQKFMGCYEIRRRAQAFLDAAAGHAAETKLAKELESRDQDIAALKAQLQQLLEAQAANAKAAAPEAAKKG